MPIPIFIEGVGNLEFPDGTSEEVIQRTVNDLVSGDASTQQPVSAPTPTTTAQIPTQDSIPEAQLDIQEESARPTASEFASELPKAAGQELRRLGTGIKQIAKGITTDISTFVGGTEAEKDEITKRRGKEALSLLRGIQAGPGVPLDPETIERKKQDSKEIVFDMGKTFGVDFENNRADLDIALEKFQNAPIESALDAVMIGGLFKAASKSAGKSLFKATSRRMGTGGKQKIQKIISKGDVETKQILKNTSNTEVNTLLDDLYDESNTIKKFESIEKQLDNQNFIESVGNSVVKDLNTLKKRDQLALNNAIKEIKNEAVGIAEISDDVGARLSERGFLKEGNVLDVQNIEPGLSKSALVTEIKRLNDPRPMTAGDLKNRMDAISKKINWKKPAIADEGLIEIRRVYRNKLRNMSPKFDQKALEVAEKLDNFEPQLRKFEKLGAGEKFGKSPFSTREELNTFIDLMERNPDKLTGKILGDMKTIKAWNAWNKYFKQNPDFTFLGKDIPLVSSKLVPSIKKGVIKRDIGIGASKKVSSAKKLFRRKKEFAVPLRVGLEAKQEEI